MQIRISDEIKAEPVSYLQREEKIMDFLKEKGMVTVGEVIERQSEIPQEYMHEIKRKLIFNI